MLLTHLFENRINISEGGNIFKGDLATQRINQSDVAPTVAWLEKHTGLPLQDGMLGTTGRKDTSGDLDLAVDSRSISKDQLVAKLSAVAQAMKLNPADVIKKSGISVHFRTPIAGDPKKGHVQADFMFTDDPEWTKFAMAASGTSQYRGAHKHIVMSSIAKAMGLKWSATAGLLTRDSGKLLSKNPDEIAEILLGKGHDRKSLESVETLLDAIKNDPERDEKLLDARETLARENITLPESTMQEASSLDTDIDYEAGPDVEYDKKELTAQVTKMLMNLPPREERVIRMYLYQDLSLGEIGEKLNLSRERIRQIIHKVLRQIKHPKNYKLVRDFDPNPDKNTNPDVLRRYNAFTRRNKQSESSDQVKGMDKARPVKPRPFAGSQPHPFKGKLVGSESKVNEEGNPTDKITMDIPLFLRMMEYAREDANSDMDLHDVTERAIELMQQHEYLCMDNYEEIVGNTNEAKKKITAKDDPCWSGYHMVGTKTKNGREVPNCVPGKKGD